MAMQMNEGQAGGGGVGGPGELLLLRQSYFLTYFLLCQTTAMLR